MSPNINFEQITQSVVCTTSVRCRRRRRRNRALVQNTDSCIDAGNPMKSTYLHAHTHKHTVDERVRANAVGVCAVIIIMIIWVRSRCSRNICAHCLDAEQPARRPNQLDTLDSQTKLIACVNNAPTSDFTDCVRALTGGRRCGMRFDG